MANLSIFILLTLYLLPQNTWGNIIDFESFFKECKKLPENQMKCKFEIHKLLKDEKLWGKATSNLKIGKKFWKNTELSIKFHKEKNEEGGFQIFKSANGLLPRIAISSTTNPYDLLITVNHELTHFANSEQLINQLGVKKNKCISSFKKNILINETNAFQNEIIFWKESPKWFKDRIKNIKFNSKILNKYSINYHVYYAELESKLIADKNYILKRYIKIRNYPKCVSEALKL